MPGLGDAGVQRTLRGIISKTSKEHHRLESASNKLSAASASKGSALLGILIQHESSGGCGASRNDPHRHESAAAGHALDRQCRLLAADAPRAAQQHSAAGTAPLMPADAPGRQSMAECPLCGSSVPVEQLQAHVDAELQKLDAAASQASSVPSVAIAQHARQVLQSIAVQPSKMAQPTAGLPPRHGLQTGHLRPIRADHGSQRSENALWPQSGPSERHTLSGSSRHWLRPTAQQATAARSSTSGRHFTLPQQSQKPEKSMQQPGLAIPLACRSSAAQQTQRPPRAPHSSGLQAGIPAQPRQQLYHSRQQRERGQPREPCSRSPAQQRAGAASHRQPSGKRKAQVHVFGAGLGTGRRQPQQQRAPPARQQGFNHYDNGRGLWDGDMAGLDGLETVGLDCWEGFGTMSMGRL